MGLQKCELSLNRSLRELSAHGTPEFPCAGYRAQYTDRAEDVIGWHWHEELEIVYVESGNLKLQIPEKTYHLKRHDIAIINSNILHSAAAYPHCELHSLVFGPLLITGGQDSVFAVKYITPLTGCASFDGCLADASSPDHYALTSAFEAAFEALSLDAPGHEFIIREKLSNICLKMYQKYEKVIRAGIAEPGQDSARIRRMLDYIHAHFPEKIELLQIAQAADIGERECLRCFQRTIQISPLQYLIKYRVAQGALSLLRNQDISISNIAIQNGFESPGNFSQMFKRYYNCTPREYRKKNFYHANHPFQDHQT